jgi:radical SAM protein with 4Fe4S-binding SPASM domain
MADSTERKLICRYENFGGIIAGREPPFLAFVDRDYMRNIGFEHSSLWDTADISVGKLTAPTEVHFAITNRCSAGCAHCYMAAGQPDNGELDTAGMKKAIDILASMKVFHIAMGGGEALERSDLFEVAQYAREKGIVPNLTVSGMGVTPGIADRMKVFGQVNISLDGVGPHYSVFRGKDMFPVADNAIKLLTAARVPTGINTVIGRENFPWIDELFMYASQNSLNEIEFLRLKPSGRGLEIYKRQKTTRRQNVSLAPMLARLSEQYKITAKIDCSFVPMFCYHDPPPEALEAIATYGCEAGNVLLGIRSNGMVAGCSFLPGTGLSVFDLEGATDEKTGYAKITDWLKNAPLPCASCKYLNICKGGCHAVSAYAAGDFNKPDPDCPRVVEYSEKEENDSAE